MAVYNPQFGDSLFDVAARLYGDTALGISDLLTLNPQIDVDSSLYGVPLTYTPGLKRDKPNTTLIPIREAQESVIVADRQNVYDLAIQVYGDLSKIGLLLEKFPNLNNSATLGTSYSFDTQIDPIAVYLKQNRVVVATDTDGITELTVDTIELTVDSDLITADQTIQ